MAFFYLVDPSTESLLWPGHVGFCISVAAPTRNWLLLQAPAGSKQVWTAGTVPVASCRSFLQRHESLCRATAGQAAPRGPGIRG